MNEEEIEELIDNCKCEDVEIWSKDILYYCRFNDIEKLIEILIKKIKDGSTN